MVHTESARERAGSEREGKGDEIVGVEQVVRRRAEVELREHRTGDAQLQTIARVTGERAEEGELVGDADRGDVRRQIGLIAALIGGERARCLGVRDERTEHVPAR